jgi:Mitochondrial protein from FMP27
MGVAYVIAKGALLTFLALVVFSRIVYLVTGILIKRIGYLSIRWIQWISRSKRMSVEIRKIGLRFQRPSITRRSWLGIVVSDATITIRPELAEDWESDDEETVESERQQVPSLSADNRVRQIGRMLGKFTQFRVLNWVDIEFSSTKLVVEGAGTFQMGMFLVGMNSKPQMFKKGRVLSSADTDGDSASPAQRSQPHEITVTIRDLYFFINEKEIDEIAKTVALTVNFFVGGEHGINGVKAVLRIAGFSIPYNNFVTFQQRITEVRVTRPELAATHRPRSLVSSKRPNLAFMDIFEELQVLFPFKPFSKCRFMSRRCEFQ